MQRNERLSKILKAGILSAVAIVVMYLETPPVFSSFLKFDFSDVVALIGGFALGPIWGVAIQFVKNIFHLPTTITQGVGELANFLIGISLVVPAAMVYQKDRTRKGAFKGLVAGVVSMVVVGMVANHFLLLPIYASLMGFTMDMVVDATNFMNPLVTDRITFLLFAIAPFNLLKGTVVSVITLLTYKYVARLINGDVKTKPAKQ